MSRTQIANWVAQSVLSREDSRKRATIIKQFILIADVSSLLDLCLRPCRLSIYQYPALSYSKQLLEYGSYHLGPEYAPNTQAETKLGASEQSGNGAIRLLRSNPRLREKLRELSIYDCQSQSTMRSLLWSVSISCIATSASSFNMMTTFQAFI